MPADRFAHRIRSLVVGVIVGAGLVAVIASPAAAADPVFAEGDCVVYRMPDNGPGGAQCSGVDLSGTRFGEGDFRGANLIGANFAGGDVQGAVFSGANLDGADFSGTRIVGADFSGSSILPATVDLVADASGTAPVQIAPSVPAGLTLNGCSIVGAPVESGQAFPIGTSNILCELATSFNGTASAVMTVNVTASTTATPTATPLFTPEPVTSAPTDAAAATSDSSTPNWLMIGGFIGGGLLVALGIIAFVVSSRRSRA
ncbi:pentapeptide repeat-containing protein [Herbiconiux daphne]|uniref:Pentapeptide repeat-containing protein n=1 Tax=Herbiconiux daphne TaxID=2970914 RepID=A0ABT2H2N7_9MICO|nr:pentapeptide repeat-containing protein [Herbiconiux daphne]MCS5734218.1 pentapeptide repeat-containing protein [Herbiconiux daphne]